MSSNNMYNPENPYVLNENYYENTTYVIYKDTTFYLIFRISFILCAFFSLLTIGFIVFLVIFKTPKSFKPCSKMLLIYAIADSYLALGVFLLQPRVCAKAEMLILSFTGPFSYLSYQSQCYMMGWLGSAVLLASSCIPVQYYIRYSIIKNDKSPSLLRIIFYFCIAILFACPFFYLAPRAYCSLENVDHIDFAAYWHQEVPVPKLLVGIQSHPSYIFNCAYLLVVQASSYILSIIFARKSLAITKGKFLSPKTKALQQQFSKTLLVQSFCPLVTVIIPPTLIILMVFLGFDVNNFCDYFVIVFVWSPVLNGVATIFLIVPYRNYCVGLFILWKKKLVGNPTVAVAPISSIMFQH